MYCTVLWEYILQWILFILFLLILFLLMMYVYLWMSMFISHQFHLWLFSWQNGENDKQKWIVAFVASFMTCVAYYVCLWLSLWSVISLADVSLCHKVQQLMHCLSIHSFVSPPLQLSCCCHMYQFTTLMTCPQNMDCPFLS